MVFIPIPPPPSALSDPDPNIKAMMELWFFNNPIDNRAPERGPKIPLPKPPGPTFALPLAKMLFPLTEFQIPFIFQHDYRRIAIFPTLSLTLDYIKFAQYATLALIYQIPTNHITAGLIIAPSVTAATIAETLRVGLSISLVPITFIPTTK
jgi:hypothetical protein